MKMIYNDRVILVYEAATKGPLDGTVREVLSKPIPCMRSMLTNNEQVGLYGKYQLGSFKLHIQGDYGDFKQVIYAGRKRLIQGKRVHKNSTVIYV